MALATSRPAWLDNARQAAEENAIYIPDQSDLAVLRNIPYFDVEIITDPVYSGIPFHIGGNQFDFESQDDMMIGLEGLCWRSLDRYETFAKKRHCRKVRRML